MSRSIAYAKVNKYHIYLHLQCIKNIKEGKVLKRPTGCQSDGHYALCLGNSLIEARFSSGQYRPSQVKKQTTL